MYEVTNYVKCFSILVNCVDRHKEKDASRVALIWEKDEPGQEERVTYGFDILFTNYILCWYF